MVVITKMKLNLGCASTILPGYVNIDCDTLDEIKLRYPKKSFPDAEFKCADILHLSYENETIDEINADGFIEHLSFVEERRMFEEIYRMLKPGGKFTFSVPNFQKVVELWLKADDDWKDFYSLDIDNHWFGTYTYEKNNKWGYLTAMIYGSQNGVGQYHKNCYTIPKINAMLIRLKFTDVCLSEFYWKGDRDPMIKATCFKPTQ